MIVGTKQIIFTLDIFKQTNSFRGHLDLSRVNKANDDGHAANGSDKKT